MSSSDTTNALLTANKQLATWLGTGRGASVEGGLVYPRSNLYGEEYAVDMFGVRVPALADEGSYWVAHNVPGTPIIDTAALTAFAATTPTMVLVNNNPAGSGINIYPTRIKVQVAAAGTSGTNWLNQWIVDTGNRYTSGGTQLTAANPNLSVLATKTGALVYFGAITAPAANAPRIIAASEMRTVIKVIGDEYTFEFGGSAPSSVGMPTDGTLQLHRTMQLPPVVLAPQQSLLWYEYAASQGTAASFDYIQAEWVER
jgi:hypothetical protein